MVRVESSEREAGLGQVVEQLDELAVEILAESDRVLEVIRDFDPVEKDAGLDLKHGPGTFLGLEELTQSRKAGNRHLERQAEDIELDLRGQQRDIDHIG